MIDNKLSILFSNEFNIQIKELSLMKSDLKNILNPILEIIKISFFDRNTSYLNSFLDEFNFYLDELIHCFPRVKELQFNFLSDSTELVVEKLKHKLSNLESNFKLTLNCLITDVQNIDRLKTLFQRSLEIPITFYFLLNKENISYLSDSQNFNQLNTLIDCNTFFFKSNKYNYIIDVLEDFDKKDGINFSNFINNYYLFFNKLLIDINFIDITSFKEILLDFKLKMSSGLGFLNTGFGYCFNDNYSILNCLDASTSGVDLKNNLQFLNLLNNYWEYWKNFSISIQSTKIGMLTQLMSNEISFIYEDDDLFKRALQFLSKIDNFLNLNLIKNGSVFVKSSGLINLFLNGAFEQLIRVFNV